MTGEATATDKPTVSTTTGMGMIQPKKQRQRQGDSSLPPVTKSPRKGSKSYDRGHPNAFAMAHLPSAPPFVSVPLLILPSAPIPSSAPPVPRTISPSSVVDAGSNSSDDGGSIITESTAPAKKLIRSNSSDDGGSVNTESAAPAKKLVRKVRRVRVPVKTTSTSTTTTPSSAVPTPPILMTPSISLPGSAAVRKDLDALMQFAVVRKDLDALMQRKQQEAEVRQVHKQVEVEVRQALASKEQPRVSVSRQPAVQKRRVGKLGGVPIESESATTTNGTSTRTSRRPSTTSQQRRPSTTSQQRRPSTASQQRRPSTTSQQRRPRNKTNMTADRLTSTVQTSTNNIDGKAVATQISTDTADGKDVAAQTAGASPDEKAVTATDTADAVSTSSLESLLPGNKKTRKFLTRRGSFKSTCTSATSKKEKSTTSTTASSSSPSSSSSSSHIIAYIASRFRGKSN